MMVFLTLALFFASSCFGGETATDIDRAKAKAKQDLIGAQKRMAELERKSEDPKIKQQRLFLLSLRGTWTPAPIKEKGVYIENDTVYVFDKELWCRFTVLRREAFRFTIVTKPNAPEGIETIRFEDNTEVQLSTNGQILTMKDKSGEQVYIKTRADIDRDHQGFIDRALESMANK
jgi:hypothetical protein